MQLETEIARINQALSKGITRSTKLVQGLAVPFKKGTELQNIFFADNENASLDDAYQVQLFHLSQGGAYTRPEAQTGRTTSQRPQYRITLIGYTDQAQLLDYCQHTLASLDRVELIQAEIHPTVISRKYLFLTREVNATAPRQLFALTYQLTGATLGGTNCPKFTL